MELKEKVKAIKIKLGEVEDLDLYVFEEIKKDLGRDLLAGEKAHIRYILDQDEKSRESMTKENDYSEEWREKFK